MKKKMIQSIFLLVILLNVSVCAQAQGSKIAREMKEYIDAGIKIKPKTSYSPTVITSSESDPPMSIGGQIVDDANSVIYKAFSLHPEWKNSLVVADWTGSMYPYVGQVMRWHKVNIGKKLLKYLVLFNDGNDKLRESEFKPIGSTGGIYHADPNDMDDFLKKVEIAVNNGSGGDAEENDIEAILEGIETYSDIDYVILIADNSPVRDIELLRKINKPVHVILCDNGWVIDYIKIAYKTGGSITTMQDELDFSNKNIIDPKNIILEGIKYKL
jgi:hypothetical protein